MVLCCQRSLNYHFYIEGWELSVGDRQYEKSTQSYETNANATNRSNNREKKKQEVKFSLFLV
jgi:hypothetical protein